MKLAVKAESDPYKIWVLSFILCWSDLSCLTHSRVRLILTSWHYNNSVVPMHIILQAQSMTWCVLIIWDTYGQSQIRKAMTFILTNKEHAFYRLQNYILVTLIIQFRVRRFSEQMLVCQDIHLEGPFGGHLSRLHVKIAWKWHNWIFVQMKYVMHDIVWKHSQTCIVNVHKV